MQFEENLIVSGHIVCGTGLHVGGANESIEIGGIDNIIIRDAISENPFIPGSSLKGKMRSLMELNDPDSSKNIIGGNGNPLDMGKPCKCGKCLPCKIFGTSADETAPEKQMGPTRTIFRDAFPTKETIEMWTKSQEVIKGAEVKYENTINRINSEANPRPSERVPKGSKFDFEIVFSIYDKEDKENFKGIFEAMMLVEDNYIGGSGTRGYGKISFEDISVIKRTTKYYKGSEDEEKLLECKNAKETLKSLSG
jgi:CRISPR-associated protein Csm3